MYESTKHRPISRPYFRRRRLGHFLAASGLILGSLLLGMAGYAHYEHLAWHDAFLNAAMLLGGMGPVESPLTDGGKLFAGLYALCRPNVLGCGRYRAGSGRPPVHAQVALGRRGVTWKPAVS